MPPALHSWLRPRGMASGFVARLGRKLRRNSLDRTTLAAQALLSPISWPKSPLAPTRRLTSGFR